jgi:hypothetical protein
MILTNLFWKIITEEGYQASPMRQGMFIQSFYEKLLMNITGLKTHLLVVTVKCVENQNGFIWLFQKEQKWIMGLR